ncbi:MULTISPECIES: hypothetical protein [Aerosakkonema]|uniref:hypothetical protein n=1 Tax=Aerosakkonema TaxID=1246629 RepID=UPI0035B9C1AD
MVQEVETAKFTAAELDRLATELNRDGICVIRGLFDRHLIEEWAEAFDALSGWSNKTPVIAQLNGR